jgi:DNA mismatch endonuclease, patch repair protein
VNGKVIASRRLSAYAPPSPGRSRIMSAIRSKGNTTTELALAKLFRRCGISGWRRHSALAGRPDFTFPKEKLAVFVDGCFWHGCPRCSQVPLNNRAYWLEKIERNKRRDRRVASKLRASGWSVCRIWEHALSNGQAVERRVRMQLRKASRRRLK